jgi:hypothetical protein
VTVALCSRGFPIGISDSFGDKIVHRHGSFGSFEGLSQAGSLIEPVLLSLLPRCITVPPINNAIIRHGNGFVIGNPANGRRDARPIHIPNGIAQQASAFGIQRSGFAKIAWIGIVVCLRVEFGGSVANTVVRAE